MKKKHVKKQSLILILNKYILYIKTKRDRDRDKVEETKF